MTQYPPKTFCLQRIFQAIEVVKLFCKIHEYKRVDLMQGGGVFSRYYIPNTATQAYFRFLFYLLINQIYVPHTNVV